MNLLTFSLFVAFSLLSSSCSTTVGDGQKIRRGSIGAIQKGVSYSESADYLSITNRTSPHYKWVVLDIGTKVKVVDIRKGGSWPMTSWAHVDVELISPLTGKRTVKDSQHLLWPILNGAVRPSNDFLKFK